MGRKATVFKADFDNVEEVVKLGDKALEFLGRVDCLVNNAGITFNKPFRKVTVEQFDRLYHVNVRAQFFLTQRIAEEHGEERRRRGLQHHVDSRRLGAPEHSVYAGSKGAIIAYTRSLAVELAHKGIRVNAIAPGCVPVENYNKVLEGYDAAGGFGMGEERDSRRPPGKARRNRQDRRVPLLRGRRVHHRPDDRGRRRHHVADVADLRFPQRVGRPIWNRLPARSMM